ncbi:MAG: FtsK/SpoIIIE domain-containing protein [Chloroflexota bacterium]|nr:FtsK/SpoIIIE domain-containing protein [Chloroflexota bacterium]
MKQAEIEGLPGPGEPLRPAMDPSNEHLMEESLKARLDRIRAKLSWRERWRLKKRGRQLRHVLIRVRWNQLILERQTVWESYQQAKADLLTADNDARPAIIQRGRTLAARGREINAKIAFHQPTANAYADILARLSAHDAALAAEREEAENQRAFEREALVWQAQIKAVFRNSPRLHHSWTDSEGRAQMEIPQIEHVHLLTDRVMFQVKTSAQSIMERFMRRWHLALPYGVDVIDLMSDVTLENLSAACNRVVTVERSKKGTSFFYVISRLDSPDGIPDKVLFNRVWDWYPREQHSKTPWFAGMSANRKIEHFNFEDYPHLLIGGATKGGKSNFINQMIACLVQANSPSEVRLVLIDLKGGVEFTHWSGIKHALMPIIKRPEDVLSGMEKVRAMLDKRLALFEQKKVKNLASYNAEAAPGEFLPRVITVIDEMATLMEQDDIKGQVDKLLNVVASQGRAVGIHLVICTQRPSADVIMGWMKTNASLLISAKMPHYNASLIILGTDSAAKLPSIPGRMVFSRGRDEVVCQTPFISDSEIARAVAISSEYDDPDNSEIDDAAAWLSRLSPKFGRDQVIQIALESLDGKLSPTRMMELVPPEVSEHHLRRMISAIVEEGVGAYVDHCGQLYRLSKVGKTYKLNLDSNASIATIATTDEELEVST